jgi:glycosyltransferase involved in cell wall biosynthesis
VQEKMNVLFCGLCKTIIFAFRNATTMSIQPLADTPKVSVIVPVWNPGSGISRCIGSLRNQTLDDIEMIFVDDCGTDGAMDVVRAAEKEDPRIRIMENSKNIGPGISRNKGIEVARGDYLSFIDADDYVNPVFLNGFTRRRLPTNWIL